MRPKNQAELNTHAQALVKKVITEVFGQMASQRKINEVAKRVAASIPVIQSTKSSAPDSSLLHFG